MFPLSDGLVPCSWKLLVKNNLSGTGGYQETEYSTIKYYKKTMYDFNLQFETNGRDLEMKMECKIPTYNHNTSKNTIYTLMSLRYIIGKTTNKVRYQKIWQLNHR